jgi:hypothetical protein
MEGSAVTTTDYSTISNHELVERFAPMSRQLAANAPPGVDIDEWTALGRELVSRIPGVDAEEFDNATGG